MAPRPFSSRWFRHSVVTGWLLWLYHKTEVVTKIQPGTTRRDLENWKWGNMAENNKKLIQNWVAPQITWFQSKNGDFFGDKRDQYYKALLSTSRGALLPHVPHKLHSKTRKIFEDQAMSHARLMPPPVKAWKFFLDPKMFEKILGKVFGNIWIKHVNFQQKNTKGANLCTSVMYVSSK